MSVKKCSNCNLEVPKKTRFCPECGSPFGNAAGAKPEPKKSSSSRDTFIIIGVLVVIVVGYLIVNQQNTEPLPVEQAQPQQDFSHPDIGEMEGMLENMPTDFPSLVTLGNQNMDQGHSAMAAEAYKRALVIKPNEDNVRTDYGACLHAMGLPERAIEEFDIVLKNNPQHEIAMFNKGIVYYTSQQADSARYYWEKYLTLFPQGTAADQAREFLKMLES